MNWLKSLFNLSNQPDKSNPPALTIRTTGQLIESLLIPNPTRSLLWCTSEDIKHISSPFSTKINISIEPSGIKTSIDNGHNFYGEPSLIWENLPIEKNTDLDIQPIYYPSYFALMPRQRYQYLNWLRDTTQPTNLSYVFLYYYGLERHLLIGDFDAAAEEILKLLKYHDKGTFRTYAQEALICSALYRGKTEILKDSSLIFDGISNETLLIRKKFKNKIRARDILRLAPQLGFNNRRYIKTMPNEFESELTKLIDTFESSSDSLLDLVPENDMDYEMTSVFANMSLPAEVRNINIPRLLDDDRFRLPLKSLLEQAHQNLKIKKQKQRKSR